LLLERRDVRDDEVDRPTGCDAELVGGAHVRRIGDRDGEDTFGVETDR
jgi:hypothetical protein